MDRLLDDAKRMVLAWHGSKGPILAPMAFWWDGRHIWFSTSGDAGKVRGLQRDERCTMLVMREAQDPASTGTSEPDQAALLRGRARIFRPSDLVAMATHGAFVAAAQAALAVKNYTSIAGYMADVTRVPARWMPNNRVMVRISVEDVDTVTRPHQGPGIAPGLPPSIPPEVRRLVAGARRVVVGTRADGELGLMPAVWSAGYSLTLPDGLLVEPGTPVSVVVDHDPGFRPTDVAGIAVNGTYDGVRVDATRIRWWHGFDGGVVDVPRGAYDPIVIPD